jgi:hypothetical protein
MSGTRSDQLSFLNDFIIIISIIFFQIFYNYIYIFFSGNNYPGQNK